MDWHEKQVRKNKKTYIIFLFVFGIGLLLSVPYLSSNDDDIILYAAFVVFGCGLITLLSIYQIFSLSSEISRLEKEAKKKADKIAELCKVHGEEFGDAVYHNKVLEGMKESTVVASLGKPKLNKHKTFYYSNLGGRSVTKVFFKTGKVSEIEDDLEPFELNMPKAEVISLWGKPADKKKTVFKTKTKSRWFYFPRTTRQRSTVYGYHVDLEDDLVVGWKELE